jgi:hypothetical protein
MGITLNPSNKLELEKTLYTELTDAEVLSITNTDQSKSDVPLKGSK